MKKKVYSKIRYIIVVSMAMLIACMTTSCAWFDNEMKNIKGELIGNKFNIDFMIIMGIISSQFTEKKLV